MVAFPHRAFIGSLLALALAASPVRAQLDIGTWTGAGCCDFGFRGYVFTAPVSFFITGLRVGSTGTEGQLEVLRFDALPAAFPSTTNLFTSMFSSATMSASTNLAVNAGDIIGIYGYDVTNGYTPYSTATSGYLSSIFGNNVQLYRSGQQALGQASNMWWEPSGPLGMIEMDYVATSTVPEPSSLSLLGLGLFGILLVGRRRRDAS